MIQKNSINNHESITVSVEDVQTIINWWRCANEAPGGCTLLEAINGMGDAVWNLELARREQFEAPFVHHEDCHHKDGTAIVIGPGGIFYCMTCSRRNKEQFDE